MIRFKTTFIKINIIYYMFYLKTKKIYYNYLIIRFIRYIIKT